MGRLLLQGVLCGGGAAPMFGLAVVGSCAQRSISFCLCMVVLHGRRRKCPGDLSAHPRYFYD
eukprot:scaffold9150_cov120-Isochrysis_galbana.AAC.9